jgi:PIN domain nuclease of toxin-antitoxin system
MSFLLDTHVFLWFVFGDRRLENKYRQIIKNRNNEIFISLASFWEIAIKNGQGNLSLKAPFLDFIDANVIQEGIKIFPIDLHHLDQVQRLPLHHRDPFDRLIIAQSIVENIPIITDDPKFKLYNVNLV